MPPLSYVYDFFHLHPEVVPFNRRVDRNGHWTEQSLIPQEGTPGKVWQCEAKGAHHHTDCDDDCDYRWTNKVKVIQSCVAPT